MTRPRKPPVHGTRAGWLRHRAAKQRPCDACHLANNTYVREWGWARRRAAGVPQRKAAPKARRT